MADNYPIILEARADTTQFFKDIADATSKAQRSIKPLKVSVDDKATQPLGKIRGEVSEFNKSIDAATARVIAFSATTGILYGVANAFKALVKETIEVEKTMTEINTVLNTNQKTLESFNSSLFDIAKNTAQSYKTVATAALELSRQGLSVEETLKRTESALILTRISGLDAAQAVNTLTAAINGFSKAALSGEEIVNKLASVDAAFAVSTKDLAEALTRVGATAEDTNVSFEELVATVTAVQQTTSRGGAVIGNALKTIFTRIGRGDTIQQLKDLGVAINESQGGIERLKAISQRVKEVDSDTANLIKELAGGVFQINVVSAALGDLSKEFSIYDNALKVANNSTGDAIRRNDLLNQSLSALVSQSSTSIDQLISKIGQISLGDNLKTLFSSFNGFIGGLGDAIDAEPLGIKIGEGLLKGIGNFITGPGLVIALGAFMKLTKTLASDAFGAFKQVAGITTEADKQAILQKQIGSYLEANIVRYASIKGDLAQMNALQSDFINKLASEAKIKADINIASRLAASSLINRVSINKTGRETSLIPRAAEGFVPAMNQEMLDIRAGTGGAKSFDKPIYIPKFNFGDRVGPVIANTGEKVVTNFLGGGGSAILNRDMIASLGGEGNIEKYGKVKNFAGGYNPISSSDSLSLGPAALRPGGIEAFIKGLDLSGVNFDVQEKKIRKQITSVIEDALDVDISKLSPIPKKAYTKLVSEVLVSRQADIETLKNQQVTNRNRNVQATQSQFAQDRYSKVLAAENAGGGQGASMTAGEYFAKVQTNIDSAFGKLRNATQENVDAHAQYILKLGENFGKDSQQFKEIKDRLNSAVTRKNRSFTEANAAAAQAASPDAIFLEAQQKLSKRNMFRFAGSSTDDTLNNISGYNNLPAEEKTKLRQRVLQENRSLRSQKFQNASLGISIASSLASPFIDQGQAAAQEAGNKGLAGGLGVLGGAAQGASLGAIFGLPGLVAGTAAGGIYGILDALDQSDEKFKALSKTLDELNASTAQSLNGFSSYIQTQQKLNSIIDSGGKNSDIDAVQKELAQVFASISDPKVRQSILGAKNGIEGLVEALGKAQAESFTKQKALEAVTLTAQEKDKNTSLGFSSSYLFGQKAISDISQSIVGATPSDKINEFSNSLKNLDGNLSSGQFEKALSIINIKAEDAVSIFNDLGNAAARLQLLNSLKSNLDFSKEFAASTKASVEYKKSIADINKIVGFTTSIRAANFSANQGFASNAFGVRQNFLQGRASINAFDVGQVGQSRISNALQEAQLNFANRQQKESVDNDLRSQLGGFISENRTSLNNRDGFVERINKIIQNGGDTSSLLRDAEVKAVSGGEGNKVFMDLVTILTDIRNKAASIDDNTESQKQILSQTQRALETRADIDNKLGLLGGAEGQINFGRSGLERFSNRSGLTQLSSVEGSAGLNARSENALGVVELAKSFGNIAGFKITDLVPNAEALLKDSIKENLFSGLGRSGIDISPAQAGQIDNIAALNAKKLVGKEDISPERLAEITGQKAGEAVAGQFKYSEITEGFGSKLEGSGVGKYTSTLPAIEESLKRILDIQTGQNKTLGQKNDATKNEADITGKINDRNADSRIRRASNDNTLHGDNGLLNTGKKFLSQSVANSIGDKGEVYNATFRDNNSIEDKVNYVFNKQLNELVNKSDNLEDFKKEINDTLNRADFRNQRMTLKTGLVTSGLTEERAGKATITDEGFDKILQLLSSTGALTYSKENGTYIKENNSAINTLTTELNSVKNEIANLNKTWASAESRLKVEQRMSQTVNPLSALSRADLTFNAPEFKGLQRYSGGAFDGNGEGEFTQQMRDSEERLNRKAEIERQAALEKAASAAANARAAIDRDNKFKYGKNDSLESVATARLGLGNNSKFNPFLDLDENSIQLRNLQLAKAQSIRGGEIGVDTLSSLNASRSTRGTNVSNLSERLANSQLIQSATDSAQALKLRIDTNPSEYKELGARINREIKQYTKTRIEIDGIDSAQAEAEAKALRQKIEKTLGDIQIKVDIPNNQLKEFGSGFSSRIDEMKVQFNDLEALGSQTAESLATGFGDAFVDVIAGAKTAEDALRGLLSSVAADLARFFAKQAFVNAFSGAMGAFSGGGTVAKKASGGSIGKVPALVMGGEYKFDKDVVSAYGEDFFRDLNTGKIDAPRYASGGKVGNSGLIRGGSGSKDDIFSHFDEGTFILRKSAVAKYGTGFLDEIADAPNSKHAQGGKVKKAFWGALLGAIIGKAVQGAVVGGVTAAATGGDWKKGALLGGVAGGALGGFTGYSGAQSATGEFGGQFGQGFTGSFAWLGGGSKPATPVASGPTGTGLTPSGDFNTGAALTGIDPKDATIISSNGGYATGVGNNTFSSNDLNFKATATGLGQPAAQNNGLFMNGPPKMGLWPKLGIGLGAAALLTGVSMAIAPKEKSSDGTNYVKGDGSISTYNSDGSVNINTASGTKVVRPGVDFNSLDELKSLVKQYGGNLPQGNINGYATGGVVGGTGGVSVRERNNSNFSSLPSPYITTGSGMKDDVPAKLKKGEFVLSSEATDHFGVDLLSRMNSLSVNKQDLGGILKFEKGGAVEYDPANRDRGMFSMGGSSSPSQPSYVGGGASSEVNIEINVNIGSNGEASADSKVSGGDSTNADMNSAQGKQFANKVKTMFLELVEQEKRPGGSLYKDNLS